MKQLKHLVLTLSLLALTTSLCIAAPAGKTQQLTSPDQVPEGLAKSDWTSIRAAYEAGRHAFQPIKGGWQARNPGQQWTTKFDGRGFVSEPKGGGWQWGLELKRYGFPGATRAISGVPAVLAEGQRLTYGWDSVVQEWWVNDTRGLEHGFTVRERPAAGGDAAAPLQFELAVRGSLTAQIAADGLGVEFRDTAGITMLNYSGLKVWDADGKILPSHFEAVLPERGVHATSTSPGDPLMKRSEDRAPQADLPTVRLLVDEIIGKSSDQTVGKCILLLAHVGEHTQETLALSGCHTAERSLLHGHEQRREQLAILFDATMDELTSSQEAQFCQKIWWQAASDQGFTQRF